MTPKNYNPKKDILKIFKVFGKELAIPASRLEELAEKLNIRLPPECKHTHLSQMTKAGTLERLARGLYVLNPDAIEYEYHCESCDEGKDDEEMDFSRKNELPDGSMKVHICQSCSNYEPDEPVQN